MYKVNSTGMQCINYGFVMVIVFEFLGFFLLAATDSKCFVTI